MGAASRCGCSKCGGPVAGSGFVRRGQPGGCLVRHDKYAGDVVTVTSFPAGIGQREAAGNPIVTVEGLFNRQYVPLCRLAALIIGDRDLAEQAVMDAFADVHAGWHRLRDTTKADAYLRRAVVNNARTTSRRTRVERSANAATQRRAATEQARWPLDDWVDQQPVARAVRHLPARQRDAVALYFYADLSEAQVAGALGCTVGTVKSQLAKARRNLASVLEREQ